MSGTKIIDKELLGILIDAVHERQVEITFDMTSTGFNLSIQPWKPFSYNCPYAALKNMEDDLK